MIYNIYLVVSAILALSSSASAYFLGWSSADPTTPTPPQYYYHKRLIQGPGPGYAFAENDPRQQLPPGALPIPSVPIQTPIRAQLSPYTSVHKVQLVPCMCPVSQEYPFENYHPQQENIYLPIQHLQQQPAQQVQMQPSQIQQAQVQQLQQGPNQQQTPK